MSDNAVGADDGGVAVDAPAPVDAQEQPSEIDRVVIRFAGDSGDGMQLTGDRFSNASAVLGNDLVTLPEYPAEIRAPAGTVAGVSSFQVHISDHPITTPGDLTDVLVAMNPAALKAELGRVESGGTLIVNVDAFDERGLEKAGYTSNPIEDGSLRAYTVYEVPMTSLTKQATAPAGVKPRDAERSKNFFALGLVSWMFTRPLEPTLAWVEQRFGSNKQVAMANAAALRAGWNFGETTEVFHSVQVRPAELEPGTYTNVSGNVAMAWGLVAAGQLAKLPVFLGSYPITPASDILHELSKHKNFGIRTFQAEDEIAGIGAAIGAAFAGHLAVTTTSGPGLSLKAEAMGLAVSLELPLVIIDIQRGGPSTGLPTKTEQADLLQAMYGRHGEAPMPVLAARTPAHCFFVAIEAARLALAFRTPVIVLSDGNLANAAEPWRIPDVSMLPDISVPFATEPNHTNPDGSRDFWPYARDPETLARPWAPPGTPGLAHRVGGLEKSDDGHISYDGVNHERMIHLRGEKVARIARHIPPVEPTGDPDGDVVVVGWGSTWGTIDAAVQRVRKRGGRVAHVHLTHLNPFPANLGEVLSRYRTVLVPELNLGQLSRLLRAEYLVDARSLSKMQGMPFTYKELETAIWEVIGG